MVSSSTELDTVALDGSRTGDPEPASQVEAPAPERIGRYLVEEQVGAGGMGVVYAARDPELNRKVAIKMLNPDKGRKSWGSEGSARLLREAQAMAQLSHPNVIQIFDFGHVGDGVFIAMEFVEGTTLTHWQEPRREVEAILQMYAKAGRGLAAAHRGGLVHRDFKPDNILLGDDGRVRVADFGLARPTGLDSASMSTPHSAVSVGSGASGASRLSGDSLTEVGAVMGTPVFMSPEQHQGAVADARSDQYSFCVALFAALYDQRPFVARDLEKLAWLKLHEEITWPSTTRKIPAHVNRALRRGLSAKAEQRWPSMEELLDALGGARRRGRGRWLALAAAGGLAVAGGSAVAWTQGAEPEGVVACDREASLWNPEARASVAEVFTGDAPANAAELSDRTLGALDAYDQEWSKRWADACDAERVEVVHACLSEQRQRFDAIVERLAELDAERLQRAPRLVSWLEPTEQCAPGAERLGRPKPPVEIAEAVEALRAELDVAASYEASGAPKKGLETIDGVVERSRAVDFVPLLAEALYRQGRLRRHMSDGDGALASFTEAVHLAEANRYDTVVANAAIEAMVTTGLTLDRTDDALEWARRADAAVQRIGTGHLEEARLYHLEGIIHARAGEFDKARELMTKGLQMRREIQGPDHADVAANLLDLGAVLGDMADHEAAYETSLEALRAWEQAVGAGHQFSAFAKMNVGSELMALARFDEAQPYMESAHEILVKILGEDHPATLSALNNLGTLHQRADRLEQALPIAEQVLTKRIERFGAEHRDVGRAHGNLAVVLLKLERLDEAKAHAKDGLRVLEALHGAEHPDVMTPVKMLADVLDKQGEAEQALPLRERALEIARKAYGDENFQVGRMLASRAATRLAVGDHVGATEDAREAIERFGGEERHASREGEAGFVLAKALFASGDEQEAMKAAKVARVKLGLAKDGDEVERLRGEVDAWVKAREG